MQGNSKSKCNSESHKRMKDKAKNRLSDLEKIHADAQSARKEGRIEDVAVLEDRISRIFSEWQAELSAPSPASSLQSGSIGFSKEIGRLLQLNEEEDDATSMLKEPVMLKPEPPVEGFNTGNVPVEGGRHDSFSEDLRQFLQLYEEEDGAISGLNEPAMLKHEPSFEDIFASNLSVEDYFVNNTQHEHIFPGFDQLKDSPSGIGGTSVNNTHLNFHVDHHSFNMLSGQEALHYNLPNIIPPPSAFLGPKCALWDCLRPALGCERCRDYCSIHHANLALREGMTGIVPVQRPGGINLKDGPLLVTLGARIQGKNVGIPECEGAATAKSPWNASEWFDLNLSEGETIREWLFFAKPRRAFESGNRKQRSLPDYKGRGWHESRKQVMKEFGGHKRSYYMDPQPVGCFEWHLYEYEVYNGDACSLYRLEVKLVDEKKSPKGKIMKDSVADLQKKMGQLTAEVSPGSTGSCKIKSMANNNG